MSNSLKQQAWCARSIQHLRQGNKKLTHTALAQVIEVNDKTHHPYYTELLLFDGRHSIRAKLYMPQQQAFLEANSTLIHNVRMLNGIIIKLIRFVLQVDPQYKEFFVHINEMKYASGSPNDHTHGNDPIWHMLDKEVQQTMKLLMVHSVSQWLPPHLAEEENAQHDDEEDVEEIDGESVLLQQGVRGNEIERWHNPQTWLAESTIDSSSQQQLEAEDQGLWQVDEKAVQQMKEKFAADQRALDESRRPPTAAADANGHATPASSVSQNAAHGASVQNNTLPDSHELQMLQEHYDNKHIDSPKAAVTKFAQPPHTPPALYFGTSQFTASIHSQSQLYDSPSSTPLSNGAAHVHSKQQQKHAEPMEIIDVTNMQDDDLAHADKTPVGRVRKRARLHPNGANNGSDATSTVAPVASPQHNGHDHNQHVPKVSAANAIPDHLISCLEQERRELQSKINKLKIELRKSQSFSSSQPTDMDEIAASSKNQQRLQKLLDEKERRLKEVNALLQPDTTISNEAQYDSKRPATAANVSPPIDLTNLPDAQTFALQQLSLLAARQAARRQNGSSTVSGRQR